MSAKYEGYDFNQYLKTHGYTTDEIKNGFSRKDGMSDIDWKIGNSLYNNYTAKQAAKEQTDNQISDLEKYYGSNLDILNQNINASKQAEAVNLQKLQKYMPTQLKRQGLGGLGVSESAYIDMYNNYSNNLGSIEANYNTAKSTYDNELSSQKNELLNNYLGNSFEADMSTRDVVNSAIEEYRANLEAASPEVRYSLEEYINAHQNEGESALLSYVDENKDKLTSDDYNDLKTYIKDTTSAAEEVKANSSIVRAATVDTNYTVQQPVEYAKGKNFIINYGQHEYRVQVGKEYTSDSQIAKEAQALGLKDTEVFAYNGKAYIVSGGRIFEIENRPTNNYGKTAKSLAKALSNKTTEKVK